MSRRLDDLSVDFKPVALEFLARLTEAGIHVLIVDTLRTPAEHAQNVANGTSWTTHSKHLDGDAMDVCLFYTYALHGADKLQWDASDPAWQTLGNIAERLGLRWGGRWTHKDMGNVELVRL